MGSQFNAPLLFLIGNVLVGDGLKVATALRFLVKIFGVRPLLPFSSDIYSLRSHHIYGI